MKKFVAYLLFFVFYGASAGNFAPTFFEQGCPSLTGSAPNPIKKAAGSVVGIEERLFISGALRTESTGFIFADGYVLTTAHSINKLAQYEVVTPDCKKYTAIPIAFGVVPADLDIGVLKVPLEATKGIKHLRFGEVEELHNNDVVYTIGIPGNGIKTAISGRIINVAFFPGARDASIFPYLYASTPVQFGYSGGPLLNKNGEVVGVTAMKRDGAKPPLYEIVSVGGYFVPANLIEVWLRMVLK